MQGWRCLVWYRLVRPFTKRVAVSDRILPYITMDLPGTIILLSILFMLFTGLFPICPISFPFLFYYL